MADKVVRASFQNLRTMESLTLEYNPNEITGGRSLHTEENMVPGVSQGAVSVGAGADDPINFTIRLARTEASQPKEWVKQQIAWLLSNTYPVTALTQLGRNWTPVQFKWGRLYDLPCVLTGCKVKLVLFDGETALPEIADVEISLQPVAYENIPAPDVISHDRAFVRYL